MSHLTSAELTAEESSSITDPAAGETIYLDYHATTPCDPRVVEVVQDTLEEVYGNPSSPHGVGRRAKEVVESARGQVAEHIGAQKGEIVFTGGATESNNIALQGLVRGSPEATGERPRILTSAIEHKSVLNVASELAEHRADLEHVVISVTENGVVDLDAAEELIDERTLVVSVQAVNNEIGTIQPVRELAELAHDHGALMHTDAAQALGRIAIDVREWDIDLLSLSAHKAYGPKGVGALYMAGGMGKQPVAPLAYGGGQEEGLRPGTLNVPAIAGFGEACSILTNELEEEMSRLRALRDKFEQVITAELDEVQIIGSDGPRVGTTTNLWLKGVEAEALLTRLEGVAVSTGSACESGAPEPSHVLEAVGMSREDAYECIRLTVGRYTHTEDVSRAIARLAETTRAIRSAMVAT